MFPGATAQRRPVTFLPPLLAAALTLPFVLHQNAWWEWANPYWLLQRQAEHVSAHGLPTLFLHMDSGAFNPFYVYYTGPLLTAMAYFAVVFGAWPVFVAVTVGAAVTGYLGSWWTARNLGLSRTVAVLPALTFTTTPYVLSDLYGRGAWSEFVAINAAALLLGGVTALLFRRPDGRGGTGAFAAVVGATAVIAGAHNLIVLMSAILLPLILLALLPLRPADAAPLRPALARVAGAGVLGLGLTAAWLLPNLWYGRDTLIAQPKTNDPFFTQTFGADRLTTVLSPWPHVPGAFADAGQSLYTQAPTLTLLWALVVLGFVAWRQRRGRDAVLRPALALGALGVALLALITHPSWWLHLPAVLRTIQLPFRLVTFLTILIVLAATLALRALGGARRPTAVLAAVVAVQVAFGAVVVVSSDAGGAQGVGSPRAGDVHAYAEPPALGGATTFTQAQFRVADRPTARGSTQSDTQLDVGDPLTSDRASLSGTAPAGSLLVVPVVWSPFIKVTGNASLAGREEHGLVVVQAGAPGPDGTWAAEVAPASPGPLTAGRAISALVLLLLVGAAVTALARRPRRPRRADRAVEAPEPEPALVK